MAGDAGGVRTDALHVRLRDTLQRLARGQDSFAVDPLPDRERVSVPLARCPARVCAPATPDRTTTAARTNGANRHMLHRLVRMPARYFDTTFWYSFARSSGLAKPSMRTQGLPGAGRSSVSGSWLHLVAAIGVERPLHGDDILHAAGQELPARPGVELAWRRP